MYYIIITHSIYADTSLNDGAKLTYGLILSLSQKSGLCYANNEYLSETLNKSVRTIQSHLEQLVKKGYITMTLYKNNYRLIRTVDTGVNLKKPKNTLKNEITRFEKQIGVNEPEWFKDYVKELEALENGVRN